MARGDLLLSLVRAGSAGNAPLFRKTAEAIIAEERSKRHAILADQLTLELSRAPPSTNGFHAPISTVSATELVAERTPKRRLADLVLAPQVRTLIAEVVEEHHRAELLHASNLEPRHRLLLTGVPGNGKTSLAEALATELMVPLYVVRYDAVIGSYLGETTTRLKRLFDYLRTRPAVLFFDEFDTLGKERGDTHDTGEIKRVVSSLLLQIDDLPPYVCVVTATNHPELLDRAVWRRFQVRVELKPPTVVQSADFLSVLAARFDLTLPMSSATLAKRLGRATYAELEEFVTDIARRRVLQMPDVDLALIIAERLVHWRTRVHASR